jgi:zeaxanthin glucosyltransferase
MGLRLALLCPPLPGHLNPTLALARELARRGHEPVLLVPADGTLDATHAQIALEPLFHPSRPPRARALRHLARPGLPFGILRILRDMRLTFDALCEELPGILGRLGCEALVCDEMEPAGGLVARHMGMPFVSVASALPISAERGVAPPYLAWPYDDSDPGVRKIARARRIGDVMMAGLDRAINRRALAWQIAGIGRIDECLSPVLRVSQGVDALDFPARPAGLLQFGPFRAAAPAAEPLRLPPGPGPLVFCSLGTLQGGRYRLFHAVASACAVLGCRLVIAHGGGLTEAQVRALPGRVVARAFVDQRSVLDQCFLAVCHGGFNTVLDALAVGVPLVILPIGFEQPGIAARVRHAGAGEMVSPLRLGRLPGTMRQVLDTPSYRMRAAAIAAAIATAGGVAAAADAIAAALSGAKAAATMAWTDGCGARDDSRSGSR